MYFSTMNSVFWFLEATGMASFQKNQKLIFLFRCRKVPCHHSSIFEENKVCNTTVTLSKFRAYVTSTCEVCSLFSHLYFVRYRESIVVVTIIDVEPSAEVYVISSPQPNQTTSPKKLVFLSLCRFNNCANPTRSTLFGTTIMYRQSMVKLARIDGRKDDLKIKNIKPHFGF